jgi:hypothetical protein
LSSILLVLVLVLGIPGKVEEEDENEDEENEPAALDFYPARNFISKSLLSTVSPTGTKI